jgi:transcriptional regulator with XRE-family HTH domain
LRATREALGLSGAALARDLGISPQRYNHWETGKHPPEVHLMLRLRQIHQIPLDWVYAGDTSALPPRLLQSFVTMGSRHDAPMELKRLRATMLGLAQPEYTQPQAPPNTHHAGMHEPQAAFSEEPKRKPGRPVIKRA